MATTLLTVDCKLFQMMPYIIILIVRKFDKCTASRFSTARNKPEKGLRQVLFVVQVMSDISKRYCIHVKRIPQCTEVRIFIHHQHL